MKVIVASNLGGGIIPVGSLLFWNGTAGNLPAGWQLFNSAADAFIMGTDTAGINLTKQGTDKHIHTIGNTGNSGDHKHNDISFTTEENTSTATIPYSEVYNIIGKHTHTGTATFGYSGSHNHQLSDTDEVSHLPKYTRYYLMKSISATDIPIGAIALWSARLNDIPSGWHNCDGSTVGGITLPNICGRFIYVPNSDAAKGTIGGAYTHSHNSPIKTLPEWHHHLVNYTKLTNTSSSGMINAPGNVEVSYANHEHAAFSNNSPDYRHEHTLPSINSAVEILPPYIKAYYIMKVQL